MSAEDAIDYEKLRELVTHAVKPLGSFSARALSMAASNRRNPDLIRNFLNNGTKPSLQSVMGLCDALDVPLVVLLANWDGPVPRQKSWLTVTCAAEAGAWRSRYTWDEAEWFDAEVEQDNGEIELTGVIVRGRSMERSMPAGTILRCTPFGGLWQDSLPDVYVIVETINNDLTELTCRRLQLDNTGDWELAYESYLPEFRNTVPLTSLQDDYPRFHFKDDQDREVRIVGAVRDAFLPLNKMRRRPTTRRGSRPAFFD